MRRKGRPCPWKGLCASVGLATGHWIGQPTKHLATGGLLAHQQKERSNSRRAGQTQTNGGNWCVNVGHRRPSQICGQVPIPVPRYSTKPMVLCGGQRQIGWKGNPPSHGERLAKKLTSKKGLPIGWRDKACFGDWNFFAMIYVLPNLTILMPSVRCVDALQLIPSRWIGFFSLIAGQWHLCPSSCVLTRR